MSQKEVKSKKSSFPDSLKRALLFGGIIALVGVGSPLYAYFGPSAVAIIGTTVGTLAASSLYTYCLEKERQKGRNEGLTLIKTLQKIQGYQNDEKEGLAKMFQRAQDRQVRREKIRTAQKMNDRLALKAAILEEASASKRENREDVVSYALKKGIPLSEEETFGLHVAEDTKRRDVAKRLIRGDKRLSR